MSSELQERITVKMFVGCLITSDLQFLLNQSHSWKEWLLVQETTTPLSLQQIHFKNKTYLGCYSDNENITISQIESLHTLIQQKFLELCQTASLEGLKLYVFPQVFIS